MYHDYISQRVNRFTENCRMRSNSCAISGEGEVWFNKIVLGPGVEACHIVPEAQYHLYPTNLDPEANRGPPDLSLSNLSKAWEKTWSADNGIMLMKHLRYFFDLRLFSIHPDTDRVRCFVPYSPITKYNGEKAQLHEDVDRNALQHHYGMCCIENMGARIHFTNASKIPTPASEYASTGQEEMSWRSSAKRCRGNNTTEQLLPGKS